MIRRILRWLIPVLGGLAVAHAASAAHPFTIDDYLKLETIGHAQLDPTGRWLVYERVPPYEQTPDFGTGHMGAWSEQGARLMAVDLAAAAPRAELLFQPAQDRVYWIDGFSPSGQRFAYYSSRNAHVTFGVFDLRTKKNVEFEAAPRVDWINGHRALWTSEDTLVFAAEAEGHEPWSIGMRRQTGEHYMEEWQKAWKGKEPTVNVVVSHADGGGNEELAGRLVKVTVSNGKLETLADGRFADPQLSSDGRYLAALRQTSKAQLAPNTLNEDWITARSALWLFDLKTGTSRAVAPGTEVFPGSLAWAPDRNRLAFFSWKFGESVKGGIFLALDAASSKLTPFPHKGLDLASERERGYSQRPERVMWIDGRLAVFARATGNANSPPQLTYRDVTGRSARANPGKADWFLLDDKGRAENLTTPFKSVSAVPVHANAKQLFVLADGRVWRVAPKSAPVIVTPSVTSDLSHPFSVLYTQIRPPFTGFATFVSNTADKSTFTLVDLRQPRARVSVVNSPSEAADFVAGSAVSGAVMFREEKDNVASLVLSRPDREKVTLDTLNAHMAEVADIPWHIIEYPVAPGRQLKACVLLPQGYEPGKRYPTIVEIYPGTASSCLNPTTRPWHSMAGSPGPYSLHLLAAKGYVVIKPAEPLDLIKTADGPIAGMAAVTNKAIDAMIAQGYTDPQRIGLIGLSQGGFSSAWLATQMDRFKATVSINGWTDLYSHYFEGTADPYGRFFADEFPFVGAASRYESEAGTDFSIGRNPWQDSDVYIRNSAVAHAPSVTAPIMLVHSDLDLFPMSQYDEMFTALYLQRKEATFVRYWGEGHLPSSPANVRDLWQRIFAWYEKYLE